MALSIAGVQLVAQGIGEYISNMNRAEKANQDFAAHGSSAMTGSSQIMTGALREIGAGAVDLAVKGAQAIGDFVKGGVDLAGDFDQTMSVLKTTIGATDGEMDAIRQTAKNLGNDLTLPATSAKDAGEAMLELGKAGFTATEAMAASKGVLSLAAAGQLAEAQAAEITANALQSFGLQAKDAVMVSDLLAASANASSLDVTDMAATYKQAGAVFSGVQGPAVGAKGAIIELTTAASLLGNAGIKGSDAGTSLKQMLLQLTGPSDKAKGLMHDLAASIGVTGDIAYDAQGKMRTLPEILDLVSRSTATMTEENRNAAITQLFGADASRAVIALLKAGPEAYANMEAAVTKSGAANELAAARMTGMKGAIAAASSSLETLQLTIGEAVAPVVEWFFNGVISPGIAVLSTFVDALIGNNDAFRQLPGPLQSVVTLIAGFYNAAVPVVETVMRLGRYVGELVHAVGLGELGFGLWEAATQKLSGILGHDLTMALAGVVGSVFDFKDAFTKVLSGDWSGAWASFTEGFKGASQGYQTYLTTLLKAIGDAAPQIVAQLKTWGQEFIDWITPYIPPALAALGGLVSQIGSWIASQAPAILTQLGQWGQQLIAWIGPQIPPMLVALQDLASQLLGQVAAQAAPLLNQLGTWATQFAAWIPGAVQQFLANWPSILNSVLDQVAAAVGPILSQLGMWALDFYDWILPMIPTLLVTLAEIAAAILVFIAETAAVLIPKLFTWAAAFVEWVATHVLPMLPGELAKIATAIGGFISTTAGQAGSEASAIGTGIIHGIGSALSAGVGFIRDIIVSIVHQAVEAAKHALGISSPSRVMADEVGIPIIKGIQSGIEVATPALLTTAKATVTSMVQAMAGGFTHISTSVAGAITQFQSVNTALANVKIPAWAQGHSPPPMANWFSEIAQQCGEAVAQLVMLEDQLGSMKKLTADQKKELEGIKTAIEVIKKWEDELAKLRIAAYDAAAAIANISMGNLSFTYSLGDVSSERNDQKSIASENKKNLEEQKALKAQIQADTQRMNQATDEGTQTYYYDKLVEEQKQLNDLQYQYNFNQAKIQEDQQKINQITQLTTDAKKELVDAQGKAADYAKIDAKLGQDYYKMESDYIQQLNSLKKKQIESTSADEYQMYAQQIDLLNQQHDAQTSLFGIEAEQRAKELSDMAQAAQDAKNALKNQAYEIAGGIMQGIYDKAADIAQAISDTIIKAIEMAQGKLEIGSPSKLTARLLGKPLMQGITQEMMRTDVAGVLSDSLVQPIASAAQIMNQNSGNSYASASTYNYSPVYQSAPNSPQQDFYLMRAGLLPV